SRTCRFLWCAASARRYAAVCAISDRAARSTPRPCAALVRPLCVLCVFCVVALANWQEHLQAGPAERRRPGGHAAVVEHDDFLHEREPEARAVPLRREERTEHAIARRGLDTGPVVVDGDPRHLVRAVNPRS